MKEFNNKIARLFAELYAFSQTNASSGIIILFMTGCASLITALTFVIALNNMSVNVVVKMFGFSYAVNNLFLGVLCMGISFAAYLYLFILSLNQKPVYIDVIGEKGNLEKKLVTNKRLYWQTLCTIAIAEVVSVLFYFSQIEDKIEFNDASKVGVLIITIAIMLCVQAFLVSFLHNATVLFYRQGTNDRNVMYVQKENDTAADKQHREQMKSINGGGTPLTNGNVGEVPNQNKTKKLDFNI